jgi:hypothetical protein
VVFFNNHDARLIATISKTISSNISYVCYSESLLQSAGFTHDKNKTYLFGYIFKFLNCHFFLKKYMKDAAKKAFVISIIALAAGINKKLLPYPEK